MTGSPHACTGWPPNRPRPAPGCTRSAARAPHSVGSQRPSATTSTGRRGPAPPAEAEAYFGFLCALVALDSPPRAPLPRSSWASNPPTRTCSPTSTRGTTSKPDTVLTFAALPSLHGRHGGYPSGRWCTSMPSTISSRVGRVTARSPWPGRGSRSPRRGPGPAPCPFPFGLLQPPCRPRKPVSGLAAPSGLPRSAR